MTLLGQASRLNTANQLYNWNIEAIASMNNAKKISISIQTQLTSMKLDSSYTMADIAEVTKMTTDLTILAKTLII